MDERTIEALASGERDPHEDRLRYEFDTQIWAGCLPHDCIPECNVRDHVCGRYVRDWNKFLSEYGQR